MIQRILTASLLIPLVLLTIYWFPFELFLLLIDVVAVLAMWEYLHLLNHHGGHSFPVVYPCVVLMPWLAGFTPQWIPAFLVLTLLMLAASALVQIRTLRDGLLSISGNTFGLIYLGLPLTLAALFHPRLPGGVGGWERANELLLIFLTVWISDSAAYFLGRAIGKHHVFAHISPKKSLEGFLAGILVPVILIPLLGRYLLPESSTTFLIAAALLVSVAGIAGDLLESMFKRGAQVKDSSSLLPGHGGILDRIDSLLLAVPAYFVLKVLLESASLS
jgi:phosphatidate cytidylyltransferase